MVVKTATEPLRPYKNVFRKASVLSYLVQFPNYQEQESKADVQSSNKMSYWSDY